MGREGGREGGWVSGKGGRKGGRVGKWEGREGGRERSGCFAYTCIVCRSAFVCVSQCVGLRSAIVTFPVIRVFTCFMARCVCSVFNIHGFLFDDSDGITYVHVSTQFH